MSEMDFIWLNYGRVDPEIYILRFISGGIGKLYRYLLLCTNSGIII